MILLVFSTIVEQKKKHYSVHSICLKQTLVLFIKGHADPHLQGGPVSVASLLISASA